MARVLLLQIDGSTPNLALMRIAGHHRRHGDDVEFRHARKIEAVERDLFDVPYERVYASAIFERSRPVCERLRAVHGRAFIGGTGWDKTIKLSDVGISDDEPPDYADYPNYPHSIGFTQRGCRMKCSFCVVPTKEPDLVEVATIADIWRGDPHPRNVLLLDNDFFGQKAWRKHIDELNAGNFKVCWNQGFNVRLIGDEEAAAIATTRYSDNEFKERRLYTAWDNRKDEARLFRNLESLVRHGVVPDDILVYMLVAYDHVTRSPRPTITADDLYRHQRLREFGCRPYPMPFVRNDETRGFQRWIVKRIDLMCSWTEFKAVGYRPERLGSVAAAGSLFAEAC